MNNDPLHLQVDPNRHGNLKLEVEGELIEVMLETKLVKIDDDVDFVTAPGIINGLINYKYVFHKFLPGIQSGILPAVQFNIKTSKKQVSLHYFISYF